MKIILIIQSLIILAGAYYIFLQSREVTTVVEMAPTQTLPEREATTTDEVETEDVSAEIDAEGPAPIAGPNDAGMEWPVFDGELESR